MVMGKIVLVGSMMPKRNWIGRAISCDGSAGYCVANEVVGAGLVRYDKSLRSIVHSAYGRPMACSKGLIFRHRRFRFQMPQQAAGSGRWQRVHLLAGAKTHRCSGVELKWSGSRDIDYAGADAGNFFAFFDPSEVERGLLTSIGGRGNAEGLCATGADPLFVAMVADRRGASARHAPRRRHWRTPSRRSAALSVESVNVS